MGGVCEPRGIYKLPHKIIQELRAELAALKRSYSQAKECVWMERMMCSRWESLQTELELKNKYIQELTGDMEQIKAMAVEENMQYLRHTLVKFLCDSTRSEQSKIVSAVEQLLQMT